ncbi:MAG TPA: hypothetical protein VM118_00385, partial [Acidobacteriota bacterium]|nr:hypothetical protein [Acidobacteriota bacterium]
IGGSVFRSRYRDLYGEWRDRSHDNQYLLTAVIGYQPSERWTFSGRWNVVGGRPYTPFDAALSDWYGDGILDTLRTNGARDPAYHTLNLRVDGRFSIGGTRLVTYLSVWNVYNRENVWFHYWDDTEDREATFEQWRILPIAGIRYEF